MTKSIFTKEYRIFLELLIQVRQTKHMTQSVLAKKLKKPQSYVSKYESAERRLDIIETMNIVKVFGVSLSDFSGELETTLANHKKAFS